MDTSYRRQELNGVLMKFREKKITLASTDSFRLTEINIPLTDVGESEEYNFYKEKNSQIIIPSLALLELQRIIKNGDVVDFTIDQNQLFISSNSTKIISRLINGNYPEYKQVLPKKFEINISINKREFVDAIKIAALVASNQNGEVRLKKSKDKKSLVVSAQSIDTGDNISKIPAQFVGENFEVLFNCRYILEGLNSVLFDQDNVVIKLNQQKSPVVLKNKIEKNSQQEDLFSYVIMPIIKS